MSVTKVAVAWLLLAGVAVAGDLYVAPGAAGVPLGASANPFGTIAAAVAAAASGDTVRVGPGTYAEDVDVTRSGVAIVASGATIRSLRVAGQRDVTVSGFAIAGPKVLPAAWVAAPGVDPGYVAVVASWQGAFTRGVLVQACSNVTVSACAVTSHTVGVAVTTGSVNVRITGCKVAGCVTGVWIWAPAGPAALVTGVIDHCCVTNCLGSGIAATNVADLTVRACVVDLSGIHNVSVAASTSALVTGCLASGGGRYGATMAVPGPSAFNFYQAGPGCVATGNVAVAQVDPTGTDGNGFIADTCNAPVTFRGNTASGCAGSGYCLTQTAGCIVDGNAAVGCGYGVRTTAAGCLIINNALSNAINVHTAGFLGATALDGNSYLGALLVRDAYDGSRDYRTLTAVRATGHEANGTGP